MEKLPRITCLVLVWCSFALFFVGERVNSERSSSARGRRSCWYFRGKERSTKERRSVSARTSASPLRLHRRTAEKKRSPVNGKGKFVPFENLRWVCSLSALVFFQWKAKLGGSLKRNFCKEVVERWRTQMEVRFTQWNCDGCDWWVDLVCGDLECCVARWWQVTRLVLWENSLPCLKSTEDLFPRSKGLGNVKGQLSFSGGESWKCTKLKKNLLFSSSFRWWKMRFVLFFKRLEFLCDLFHWWRSWVVDAGKTSVRWCSEWSSWWKCAH